jgi:hypothetical protein
MKLRVSVGGREVEPANVLFDAWKFGKAAVPPDALAPFQLLAEREEAIVWLGPVYEEMIREFREDDKVGGFTPGYEGQVDYPSLPELFDLPQDSRMTLLRYLRFDILDRYLAASDREVRWVGMSIDNIALEGDWLRVDGAVRAVRGLTARPSSGPWGWFLSLFR